MSLITRPRAELLGRHLGYGFVGGVSTATGNFTFANADLAFPAPMLGLLDFTRTYNSQHTGGGVLGPGWTVGLNGRLTAAGAGALRRAERRLHRAGEKIRDELEKLEGGQHSPGESAQEHAELAAPPVPGSPIAFHDDDGRTLVFTPDGGGYRRPQDLQAELTVNADHGYTLRYPSGEEWEFTAAGRLTTRARAGQRVTVEHDAQGRLLSAAHSGGTTLTFSYGPAGRLVRASASDGQEVSYGYDENGALASVTLPGEVSARFRTGGDGRINRITDGADGLLTALDYDSEGRVVRQESADGGAVEFGYGDEGVTTATALPERATTTFEADPHGRLVKVTDAGGDTAAFTFDEAGNPTRLSAPGGLTDTSSYDKRGNLTSTSLGGAPQRLSYDSSDRLTAISGPAGTTAFGYDGAGTVPARVTSPGGAVTAYHADPHGRVRTVTDADGDTTTFDYDDAGRVTSITSGLGEVTRYSYDAKGLLEQVVAPSGATIRYEHDPAGRVTRAVDPNGGATGYRYSGTGRLLETTDPAGGKTSYTYDAAGRRTSVADALGRTTHYAYDGRGNLVKVTDPAGAVTEYAYDPQGRRTSETGPTGAVTRYSYDSRGNRTAVETPAGTTRVSYDEHGNPLEVTAADGAVTRYAYDSAGRRTQTTDPGGAVHRTEYDADGHPVTETAPDGAVTRKRWTKAGRLAAVIDPLGGETTYDYDAAGRLVKVTDPCGGVTALGYDPDGHQISKTTPAGLVTRWEHDPAGRVISKTDPRGWITRYTYDPAGRKLSQTTPSGATTDYRYDPAGQLTRMVDANGSPTKYTYDDAGRLTSITAPRGGVTRYTYRADGKRTAVTDPLGRTTRSAYDKAGRLTEVTDPAGHAQHFHYDPAGRLVEHTADDGTRIAFGYDPAGRRVSMTDATGTTHYAYDQNGRLTQVTDPDGAVTTATYNAAGRRTALDYPGGLRTGYSYDLNGRLVRLTDSRAGEAVYALDPDGRLLTEQLPGRLARRYHYEGDLLHRFAVWHDDRPIAESAFSHDPDGRIRTWRRDGRLHEFHYDPVGQLTGETAHREDCTEQLHIEYDADGNRAGLRRGEVETRYRYDDADQLLATRTRGHHHDRHLEFRYDQSGRMTEEVDGARRCTVDYDGLGRPGTVTRRQPGFEERIRVTHNGDGLVTALDLAVTGVHGEHDHPDPRGELERKSRIQYRWGSFGDLPQIISQRAEPEVDQVRHDHPGRLSADFAYGYGRTFASWRHGSAVFHHDPLGSESSTEATRDWAQDTGYGVFGTPDGERQDEWPEPELPRFGYRGELALGELLHLRARTYATRLGRFTTPDPMDPKPGGEGPASPYPYAANDPLDKTDPTGAAPTDTSPPPLPLPVTNDPGPGSPAPCATWLCTYLNTIGKVPGRSTTPAPTGQNPPNTGGGQRNGLPGPSHGPTGGSNWFATYLNLLKPSPPPPPPDFANLLTDFALLNPMRATDPRSHVPLYPGEPAPVWASTDYTGPDRPAFNSAGAGPHDYVLKSEMMAAVDYFNYVKGWKDAAGYFKAWLDGSGQDRQIDVSSMLRDLPSFRTQVNAQIAQAKAAGNLNPGWTEFEVTPQMSEDWYYALHTFEYRVASRTVDIGGTKFETLSVEIYKRYNFGVPAEHHTPLHGGPITVQQPELSHLNTVGLAQDYNIYGDYEDMYVTPPG